MIVKTQGIALRIHPWSRTSHIVTWLTPDHGRVTTVIKGACRAKSAFLGQYDLAYTCELLFYCRDRDGLHAIRECAPLHLREALRRSWRASATASYLCNLAAQVSLPQQQETDGHYRLLTTALNRLCLEPPDTSQVCAHEIVLLKHLGLMPNLARCPVCHTSSTLWLRFSVIAGRLLCAHAREDSPADRVVTLHRDVIDTLALWAADAENPSSSPRPAPSHNLALGIRRFLGIFICYHVGIAPSSRRALFELLAVDPNRWSAAAKA